MRRNKIINPLFIQRRKKIVELISIGKTPKEISKQLHLPLSTIYFRIHRHINNPYNFDNKYSFNKKQKLTNNNIAEIKESIRRGYFIRSNMPYRHFEVSTPQQAQWEIYKAFGRNYSIRMIQNWFKEVNKNKIIGRPKIKKE